MSMDLTGVTNKNEYYTNHYFATVFEENAKERIGVWNAAAQDSKEVRAPHALLRRCASRFYVAHDRYLRSSLGLQSLYAIKELANLYLKSLGYPDAAPLTVEIDDTTSVPVYLEIKKQNGAPFLWVVLTASKDADSGVMESFPFDASGLDENSYGAFPKDLLGDVPCEELATKILFRQQDPPRFLILIGMNQIALIDRNKWNEKRYLQFELEEIFSRLERTTLEATAVLLHKDSLCPDEGKILLDEFDEQSQRNASGVSKDLKYALRESVELLGNEVLYDMRTRQKRDFDADPVDAGRLTIECLRYMYRMLFVLFIEARPELGYAPVKSQCYYSGYSLESLRDIADDVQDSAAEIGDGYYLHESLEKLYDLIYNGYPKTEEELEKALRSESLHDMFLIAPLKAHIFDPEYTKTISTAKLRNSCMLQIIKLMSLAKFADGKKSRRGRVSYANLGINQMGAVYEALLSYRGFIAEQDLYEVKRASDEFDELEVGYFVPESELDQYSEEERVRYTEGDQKGKLRVYKKGAFIYRLAGREREKSASYYTPEALTKCLVKYALKELLEGKTADQILELKVCEPAMGSAAFLNEVVNQLAEAYISRKEKETGRAIGYENRFNELQKVKMYIADRNVYGVDLNPIAVELAEASLWLNTIYEGGFVPWFGTQLVNGNSLIGARRQVYSESDLKASSKGLRWYENAPERVPLGEERKKQKNHAQIYHFLLGDPGMCDYSDKVIKGLAPDALKIMKDWNKKFNAPYSDEELDSLRRLSDFVDELWEGQIRLRRAVEEGTRDSFPFFGREDVEKVAHTTIRQKDSVYSEYYKSAHKKNAGPYARLKFAMDYWCALWFWPIDKAELLPSRIEFINDMFFILVGTVRTDGKVNMLQSRQRTFWPTELDKMIDRIAETYPGKTEVDIDNLCEISDRLNLVRIIAEQNRFMHWELEFADIFAEKGGFDLVIGNPPWVLLGWNEQAAIGDSQPQFMIKSLSATQTVLLRAQALDNSLTKKTYFSEYEAIAGQQNFLGAYQNYPLLTGMKTNLFKCFLPQSWMFTGKEGVSAFVHPDGVFDDPKGGPLREALYPRLRRHYQFINELRLFEGVHHNTTFSLNVYRNKPSKSFDCIGNLFAVKAVDQCYDPSITGQVPGIKDEKGDWNSKGHPDRVITVGERELRLFAKIFDGSKEGKSARLPILHARQLVEALVQFSKQNETLENLGDKVYTTMLWNETNAQKDQTIAADKPGSVRFAHFPEGPENLIYSGPHIGVANPLFKTPRSECTLNSDYDSIDLTDIGSRYLQRCNFHPCCSMDEFNRRVPSTSWGTKCHSDYRFVWRRMLNQSGERTLIGAIIPPLTTHVHTLVSISFPDRKQVSLFAGFASSLPYDFLIKVMNKSDLCDDAAKKLPYLTSRFNQGIILRSLLLNCLTGYYAVLWNTCFEKSFIDDSWAKEDSRLERGVFSALTAEWTPDVPLRTDYARRQCLVEIDVLTAMALGMTLDQLKTIYALQFPILNQNEADTWYDANGCIVFTNNKGLTGVGFKRQEWENDVKGAPAGRKFSRTITDDTMPGGPVERTIEYVAPFDRCDRERDYETVWKFFEEKYRE